MEIVQRYFTRRLFPESLYSYKERLNILTIKSLECRKLEYDIKMYFKRIHRHTNLDPNKFFLFYDRNGVTRGHNLKIRKHLFHRNYFIVIIIIIIEIFVMRLSKTNAALQLITST